NVLMVVLVPKPRMLTGWPVGWSWPVGIVDVQTPGMRFTIWSTPVSGMAWIWARFSTVVLTSSFSRSEPRPAVMVTGGRVIGAGGAGGVAGDGSCALASDGSNARPAKAAKVAARTDNMKFFPRKTNER